MEKVFFNTIHVARTEITIQESLAASPFLHVAFGSRMKVEQDFVAQFAYLSGSVI